MTLDLAHKILNRVKDGEDYPQHIISRCLEITGDLDGRISSLMRSPQLDGKISADQIIERSQRSSFMVAGNDKRH
mgnify:CR=1 FL=1